MKVSIIYMASLYLALPSEFDTLVMRTHIYIKVLGRVLLLIRCCFLVLTASFLLWPMLLLLLLWSRVIASHFLPFLPVYYIR